MSNIKSRKYYEEYSLEEISRADNPFRFLTKQTEVKFPVEEELKNKDDEFRTLTWAELYKTASYYFDNPNSIKKDLIVKNIRANFSGILAETNSPYELPLVQNRYALLNWVCKKNNEFLEKKNSSNRVDCDVKALLNVYGPNYQAVENYIGGLKYSI